MVQWVGSLPYTYSKGVQCPALHMVPLALPEVIPESRARRKPLAPLVVPTPQKKQNEHVLLQFWCHDFTNV